MALPKAIADVASEGDVTAVAAWLDGGGNIDAAREGFATTLLMCASQVDSDDHADLVDLLLSREASVDLQDIVGATALMIAAWKNNATLVKKLLLAGAQIGLQTHCRCQSFGPKGSTALSIAEAHHGPKSAAATVIKEHVRSPPSPLPEMTISPWEAVHLVVLAAKEGDVAYVESWLDGGGDANAARDGITLLIAAVMGRQVRIVDLLLARGAAVDETDDAGNTPLMFAAQIGSAGDRAPHSEGAVGRALMQSLLRAGARPDVANRDGHTVMSLAKAHGLDSACAAVIEAHLSEASEATQPLGEAPHRDRLSQKGKAPPSLPGLVMIDAAKGNIAPVVAWLDGACAPQTSSRSITA